MKDDASGGGGAPAVGGLGSYKGVMLCSRPPEDGGRGGDAGGGVGGQQAPFRSTIAAAVGDRLGLPPPKRTEPKFEVKTRGPSAALRRHCQWIKELQEQVKDDQRQAEDGNQAQEDRKERMQQAFKLQRDAIRKIKSERDRGSIEASDVEAILTAGGKRASAPAGSKKPMWAMTADEKDGFEDEEAAQLIRFVEDLDFDTYIDDLEFREHLQVVRDRTKKLQREQDAFKDSLIREFNTNADGGNEGEADASSSLDGSEFGARAQHRLPGRPGASSDVNRPDWDASTACSDDRQSVGRDSQSAAERLLEANPQLRGIHSKGSMQRIIEKAQET